MGKKRKTSDDQHHNKALPSTSTAPFDRTACSAGMELSSQETHPGDELNSLSTVMDFMENPEKLLDAQCSIAHHHNSLGRPLFLKRSCQRYSHQSRRNAISHSPALASQGKVTSLDDGKLPFKLSSQRYRDSVRHAENQEKSYFRRERIESSSFEVGAVSSDMTRITCGTCQRSLKQNPCMLGNTVPSSEPSVVAVLVCGHVFHADCLEKQTCSEDKRDPTCPLCPDFPTKTDDKGGPN